MFKNFFGANNKTQATNTIQGYLRASNQIEAIKAQDPRYRPRGFDWPLKFGPRLQESNDQISVPLVQGLRNGAQQLQEWVNGFIAAYELAVNASPIHPPESVGQHLEAVHREMQLGMFHFQTAVDMLGALSTTQVAQPMLAQASDLLWEALGSFFTVSQLVAHPGALTQPQQPQQVQPQNPGRRPETEPPPQQVTYPPASTFVQPSEPEPEEPYGAQEAAALLNDFAQVPKRTWQPPQVVAQPQAESMLDEFAQFAQHRPQQPPASDDDPLADITQKKPVPSKQQAKPQQRNNDVDDLLSDITGGDREPLL